MLTTLTITACGNDNEDTPTNPPIPEASPEAPPIADIEPERETTDDLDISVELNDFALTVGEVSGIVHLSRPLVITPSQHFDTIRRGWWIEERNEFDFQEIDFNDYAETRERILIAVVDEHGDTINHTYASISEIDAQTLLFTQSIPGDFSKTTFTIRVDYRFGYYFDEDINGAYQGFEGFSRPVGVLKEFEYNPEQLAISCDYIEINGRLYSPFALPEQTPEQKPEPVEIFLNPMEVQTNEQLAAAVENGDIPANVTSLLAFEGEINDLTPLASLTNLEMLSFSGNKISDLRPLAGLTNLKYLDLQQNQITDLSPLSNLTNLESLNLYNNKISDLSPLAGLTNLRELKLANFSGTFPGGMVVFYDNSNEISDLTPLTGLLNLTLLDLRYAFITVGSAGTPGEDANGNRYRLFTSENDFNASARVLVDDWSPVDHVAEVIGKP